MTRVVRIELPFPPKELSPNARVHWRKKAKVTAAYREQAGLTVLAARYRKQGEWYLSTTVPPLKPPVRAVVTFVVPDRRKRDEDNLLASLKPAWDGLTDAGVLVGDDASVFSVESTFIAVTEEAIHKNRSYVIVELRSA